MSTILTSSEYAPLDPEEYKRQLLLLRSLHCARPVILDGKQAYIHTLSASQDGGHIEMTAYMTGDPTPVDATRLVVELPNARTE